MAKRAALSFRVSDDVKAGLDRAAADDDRSVSSLVERILRAWLTDKGYLPGPGADSGKGGQVSG
ncbi:ribbon-helix-helix protein, CopG family [Roseospira visakhapatnamensis]|uniref:Ribbon-helix-helix protein CopG domain-containing protein n=1 Tax=Roseospira visakhapatnamensis TaxID=390880 RepID=A0A7W6RBH1_9PROT|nr:ribbon-helix-helix protein, CopG family [Roseospira visakhapatnamensis]MBB4264808.1 hypothetical protein [Roseospira visakhapatnamensis]